MQPVLLGHRIASCAPVQRDSRQLQRLTLGRGLQTRRLPATRQLAAGRPHVARASPQDEQLTPEQLEQKRLARKHQRENEAAVYKASAIAATALISSVALCATTARIMWHMQASGEFPYVDLACTLLLVAGGMVGMEMYARYAHKVLWHDLPLGWALHKSHHEPRTGPFEANDLYAIMNAVPAMALCLYGFLTPSLAGSMCFGAGLGITLFGCSYVFVHDGMVHRRFPVGPLGDMPYFRRVTLAHQLHHSEKYGGVPFGLFLGPQELEAVGAGPELERMMAEVGQRKSA